MIFMIWPRASISAKRINEVLDEEIKVKVKTLYKKYKNKEELTKEELKFLYEIDSKIIGFGYKKDPRIAEIKIKRVYENDLRQVFDGSIKEIKGNLNLSCLIDAEGLVLPEILDGHLCFFSLT